ncbi:T9SS type A sorting domain-containing protein [Spirosoma pollinicola]|uniref:Secretion system C-terminal sorting domain-containing protein n=1 Tax=Spirosoma pollinicola TaxID=2057025 RepID=A0A2K8YTK5_9BACT|nr:T9SS type A sorting domain-containing protein [Spirosoma pollinicola]AUD00965.1 hypothetical protein CWM47_03510 [Spirosoma pollinicola]
MVRKLLLIILLGLCTGYSTFAQDPFVGIPVINPPDLVTGHTAVVTFPFGNASANPVSVDKADQLVYTFIVLPYECLRVTSFSLTASAGATYTPDNLIVTSDTVFIPYNPPIITFGGNVTRFTIKQKDTSLPIPGQATYNLVISMLAIAPFYNGAYVQGAVTSSGISTNIPTNDYGTTSVRIQGPMPVSLVSFTAKAQPDHSVKLAWTTSLETNNKGFLIERSKDLKAFEKVSELSEVAANSHAEQHYSLTDQFPYTGTSYYRLTQIDLGGRTTSFPVVSVVLRDGAYGVFPNPVLSDQPFRVSMDEPETASVNIYGADGRVVPFQKVSVEPNKLLLKASGKRAKGVYILTVEERGQTRRHRLVID